MRSCNGTLEVENGNKQNQTENWDILRDIRLRFHFMPLGTGVVWATAVPQVVKMKLGMVMVQVIFAS